MRLLTRMGSIALAIAAHHCARHHSLSTSAPTGASSCTSRRREPSERGLGLRRQRCWRRSATPCGWRRAGRRAGWPAHADPRHHEPRGVKTSSRPPFRAPAADNSRAAEPVGYKVDGRRRHRWMNVGGRPPSINPEAGMFGGAEHQREDQLNTIRSLDATSSTRTGAPRRRGPWWKDGRAPEDHRLARRALETSGARQRTPTRVSRSLKQCRASPQMIEGRADLAIVWRTPRQLAPLGDQLGARRYVGATMVPRPRPPPRAGGAAP